MKLLFVVQRYGTDVAGGAERACRELATGIAARGHEVEVLTSRAKSYVDWADEYPAGEETLDGVRVHRLSVRRPRDPDAFASLNTRVQSAPVIAALLLQREWMRMQGPELPDLQPWLEARMHDFDVIVCVTYLYWTTWAAMQVVQHRVPTVLHPCAHDEPPLELPLFDDVFLSADAFGFLTEEEELLVRERFGSTQPSILTGLGVDLDAAGDEASFRAAYGLGERPYLLFVGRLDPGKGSEELFDFFAAYKQRSPGPLALVMVGEPVAPVPPHPDVIVTGFVDEHVKTAAIAGALALVQPSFYESFSIVLIEAWAQRKPTLVQGRCAVLAGQADRSGGGIPYQGFAEFEAAVDLVVESADARRALGEAGRRYVEDRYQWAEVLDRYERFLETMATSSVPSGMG